MSTCQQYQVCPEGSCFNAKPKKQDNNTTCVIFLVLFFNSDFEQYRIHQIKTKTHCKIVKLSSHCNPGVSNKKNPLLFKLFEVHLEIIVLLMISDSPPTKPWQGEMVYIPYMDIEYLELGTFASLSVQLKNYQAEITF